MPLLADLAAFAAHGLKDDGIMVVVGNGVILPGMLERLVHRGPEMAGRVRSPVSREARRFRSAALYATPPAPGVGLWKGAVPAERYGRSAGSAAPG